MLQRVRITRTRAAGTGYTDPDSGDFLPAPDGGVLPLYDGAADVQDKGKVLTRSESGAPLTTSDATLYLPRAARAIAAQVETGDAVQVTWEDGAVDDASVIVARRLDGTIALGWL